MHWLKNPKAGPEPPAPKHVDLATVTNALLAHEKTGTVAPSVAYLQSQLPPQPLDRWQQPLPLPIEKQERLDRLVAIMSDPRARGRALLMSGTLDTIETNALRNGHPDVYAEMRTQAILDMAEAGPPLPPWAEGVLGVFFGRDAALVYVDAQTDAKPQGGHDFAGKPPPPSPADLTSEPNLKGRV